MAPIQTNKHVTRHRKFGRYQKLQDERVVMITRKGGNKPTKTADNIPSVSSINKVISDMKRGIVPAEQIVGNENLLNVRGVVYQLCKSGYYEDIDSMPENLSNDPYVIRKLLSIAKDNFRLDWIGEELKKKTEFISEMLIRMSDVCKDRELKKVPSFLRTDVMVNVFYMFARKYVRNIEEEHWTEEILENVMRGIAGTCNQRKVSQNDADNVVHMYKHAMVKGYGFVLDRMFSAMLVGYAGCSLYTELIQNMKDEVYVYNKVNPYVGDYANVMCMRNMTHPIKRSKECLANFMSNTNKWIGLESHNYGEGALSNIGLLVNVLEFGGNISSGMSENGGVNEDIQTRAFGVFIMRSTIDTAFFGRINNFYLRKEEVWRLLVNKNPSCLSLVSSVNIKRTIGNITECFDLKKDTDFIDSCVDATNGEVLNYCDPELLSDFSFMDNLIDRNSSMVAYLSPKCENAKHLVVKAVKDNMFNYIHITEELEELVDGEKISDELMSIKTNPTENTLLKKICIKQGIAEMKLIDSKKTSKEWYELLREYVERGATTTGSIIELFGVHKIALMIVDILGTVPSKGLTIRDQIDDASRLLKHAAKEIKMHTLK